jgi:serine protease Do
MKTVNIVLAIVFFVAVGFLAGYSLQPSDQVAAASASAEYAEAFPAAVQQGVTDNAAQGRLDESRSNAITRAVARVSASVVGINVIQMRQYRDPYFSDDPFFRWFFGDRSYRQEVKGLGSGFIISPDGYIITNDHVAGNATEITVTMTNGERMKAELVGSDPFTDIALLKVDAKDLPYLTLGNSDDIIIGEWAIAFGNPFGLFEINDKPTVTVGVISSVGMNLGRIESRYYREMIETDAAINGGNSGGPLVNSQGEVIGVNTLIFTGGQSTTFVGYGFAVPINKVKGIAAELREHGTVVRDVYAGFDAQPVDRRIARYFGMTRAEGVIVTDLDRDGPASKAGVKVGDIILSVNKQKIGGVDDLQVALYDSKPGDDWEMEVLREKSLITVRMTVGRRSE